MGYPTLTSRPPLSTLKHFTSTSQLFHTLVIQTILHHTTFTLAFFFGRSFWSSFLRFCTVYRISKSTEKQNQKHRKLGPRHKFSSPHRLVSQQPCRVSWSLSCYLPARWSPSMESTLNHPAAPTDALSIACLSLRARILIASAMRSNFKRLGPRIGMQWCCFDRVLTWSLVTLPMPLLAV